MKAPSTVLIKYGAGNIRSVLYALERLGVEATVSGDAQTIRRAERVIFPGVGEASTAMACLREQGLDRLIVSLTQPVLGICLGQQLMCSHSEEGDAECLGIFPYRVRRFSSDEFKIPQVGWNDIYDLRSPLFAGLDEHTYLYFVHGYYVEQGADTVATANYIAPYSAALQRDNFHAVQFHPERSGDAGHKILENFIFNI